MASTVSLYTYNPSHVLPIVFAALIGISLLLHVVQNCRYRFWRITFFMFWGGLVFTTGWILRAVSTYNPTQQHLGLYIAQSVCIYAGPPIYSAAEYNVLGRLLHYLPMYAPLNPARVLYLFIYLGVLVESLTAAGAARIAAAAGNDDGDGDRYSLYQSGGILISVGLVLQAVIECVFIGMVALIHRRCVREGTFPRNVRTLCITLYGTSCLVLLRCIFRAVEAFATMGALSSSSSLCSNSSLCRAFLTHEWYLYAFEAAPMLLYTYWLNVFHPGRFLPRDRRRYLDPEDAVNGNGTTERLGPGWTDTRSTWLTFVDLFDVRGLWRWRWWRSGGGRGEGNEKAHNEFWLRPEQWPVCVDGSFADGSATNVKNKKHVVKDAADMETGGSMPVPVPFKNTSAGGIAD